MSSWPSGWKGVVLGFAYLAYLVVGGVILQAMMTPGRAGYGSLLAVAALVVWLVWKGWLGRAYLAYLAGAYVVIGAMIMTNTIQYAVGAAVVALMIYGFVIQIRKLDPAS